MPVLCMFILYTRAVYAQNISEDFESGFPPAGWTMINAGSGNPWTENVDPAHALSGTHSMKYSPAPAKANAWAISPVVFMSASQTYLIKFSYEIAAGNTPSPGDTIRLTIGNANTVAAQTTVLHTRTLYLTTYLTQQVTYSPPVSGNYAIGLNCAADPNQREIYIDDISITENPPPKPIYVRQNANGTNDGSSWANAFTTLTAAFSVAIPGDTIKVSKGIYKPTTDKEDRDAAFSVKDYMVVLGGYPDSGNPSDIDRQWGQNPTILSGNINVSYVQASYHVVNISATSSKCILDGFVISDGYSEDKYNPSGPDFQTYGGGLHISSSFATIRNCIIRNSMAQHEGSALSIEGGAPEISNCFFINNGGAATLASAVYLYNDARPRLVNCIFANNNCTPVIKLDTSAAAVTNCVFVGNYPAYVDNVNKGSISCENNSRLTIRNSIFYGNTFDQSTDSADIVATASTVDIANTITQAYQYGSPSLTGVNPKFIDTSHIAGADGIYFTADDGLQLLNPCSPGINAGQNSALGPVSTDMLGNLRIANGVVDLGVYEAQVALSIPKTLYVNKFATGLNNGTSWANAFTDLQKAVNYCSDTIKVASGSYSPSDANERASFWMENKRIVLGGYPSTGNPANAQRDPFQNPTILTGKLSNGKRSINLLRGRFLDESAKWDGFLVTGANGEFHGYENDAVGAVFLTNKSSPEFSNCMFSDNRGDYGAALVTRNNSNPLFKDCIFASDTITEENNPGGYGGIITNIQSNPSFVRCIFRNNSHFSSVSILNKGGVFFNVFSNPVIDSCLFLNNQTYGEGAAIFNAFSNPIIKNTRFIGNMPGAYENKSYFQGDMGGDIFNVTSSPIFQNCLFIDSFYCDYGGSVANTANSNPVFENCEFRNTRAVYKGGAIYNEDSKPVFTSCVFYNRPDLLYLGTMKGASFYNLRSTVKLYNCVAAGAWGFVGNFMENSKSTSELTNCVIALNNYIPNSYSYICSIYSYDSSRTTINNSIFWKNKFGNQVYYDFFDLVNGNYQPSSTTVTHSMLETITSLSGVNNNLVGVDPLFNNEGVPAGDDSTFFTNDDGFILQGCSPAVNTGLNGVIGPLTKDILGNSRVISNIVDRGPYEFTGAPTVRIRATDSTICSGTPVTFFASGSNQGSNPVYQWQVNGVNTSMGPGYTSAGLNDHDTIKVILSSDAACLSNNSPVASAPIIMAVSTPVIASINIDGNTSVTSGQDVIITSTSLNEGSLPAYQWQDSTSLHSWKDIPGAVYPSIYYTVQSGNRLRCLMTSSADCASPVVAESNVLIFGTVTAINPVTASNYGIRIFPNPASTAIIVDRIKLNDRWRTAKIVNQSGIQVRSLIDISGKETVSFSITDLPSGVYILIFAKEDGGIAITKFVKL